MELFSTGWIITMICMVIIMGFILDKGSAIMSRAGGGCWGSIVKTVTLIIGLALSAIVAMATFFVIAGPPPGR